MSRKNKDRGACVYCGQPATTDDHIPPQTIFGENKPKDMIEVPACKKCNNGASQDDEYFRRLCLNLGTEGNQAAEEAQAAFFRSLERKEAKGMRRGFFQRLVPVEVKSGGGLFIGHTLGIRLEKNRLDKVFNRIIRGLFWRHQGQRLPDGYEAEWEVLPRHGLFTAALPSVYTATYQLLTTSPVNRVGDGSAFQYRYAMNPTDPNMMTVRMEFYQAIGFLGFTGKLEGGEICVSMIVPKQSTPAGGNAPPGVV